MKSYAHYIYIYISSERLFIQDYFKRFRYKVFRSTYQIKIKHDYTKDKVGVWCSTMKLEMHFKKTVNPTNSIQPSQVTIKFFILILAPARSNGVSIKFLTCCLQNHQGCPGSMICKSTFYHFSKNRERITFLAAIGWCTFHNGLQKSYGPV